MRIFKYISIFFLAAAAIFYIWHEPAPYQIMSGQTMGTYYSVKVKTGRENKLLHKNIKEELEAVNAEMSVFDNNSEISRINREPADKWIELSPPMQKVLQNAYTIYSQSNGAFDPTVGRLVDLWGFGTIRPKKAPSEEDIREVLKTSGFNKIRFTHDFDKIKKEHEETMINLSAIAKGYGVDRVAELLEKLGYHDYVVEIGGEVRAGGRKSDQVDGWNVGIIRPENDYTENAYVITLKNQTVATSGDYRNFIYVDDKKYSHTISPKNGYPVENNLISATVFHSSCMIADGMTTAMMAMGEKAALDYANRYNVAAVLFVRGEDNTVKPLLSERAKRLVGRK